MSEESNGIIDLANRYDEFQSEAVSNIVRDYTEKAAGRFLLVIPTGGGKTYTAVKAINSLFHQGVFDSSNSRIVWAAHREELVKQAKETIENFHTRAPEESYKNNIHVMMISGVANYVRDNDDVKVVVIDEAHHAATSNIQYGPLFEYPRLGILGLTATPSRHDGKPLEFEKESYSIGFPDLVEKQIILSPVVRRLEGDHFDNIEARGSGFSSLDALSTPERNQKIINHIADNTDQYTKVIIYAGSVKHTKELCAAIKQSSLIDSYQSVDYIVGEGWSGNEAERKEFIDRIKSYERSIVVNHDVLAEGYDDPTVNTVIMARPCRSKLVYMQAVGRGVRIDPNNSSKIAYIVEVEDQLPNIRYRIDNRWLFSEIADTLEPRVTDEYFGSAQEFEATVQKVFEEYDVLPVDRIVPPWDERSRYSLLLFRYFVGDDEYRHVPVVIDNESRAAVSNWFNFLSEHMEAFRKDGVNPEQAMKMARYADVPGLDELKKRRVIMDAMEEASKQVVAEYVPTEDVVYWINFIALRYKKKELPDDLLQFVESMVNREQIKKELTERSFLSGAQLVRFPLPLCGYVGQIITQSEFERLQLIINGLEEVRETRGQYDHRVNVRDLLDTSVLPIDLIYRDSMTTIVREQEQFNMRLE